MSRPKKPKPPKGWILDVLQTSEVSQQAAVLGLKKPPADTPPRDQQPEYAFQYAPSQDLATELGEWFSYQTAELSQIIGCAKQTFEAVYTTLSLPPHQRGALPPGKVSRWTTSKDVKRRRFVSRCLDLMEHANQQERVKGLEAMSFIVQGCYGELDGDRDQLSWIKKNVKLLQKMAVVEGVFNCLRQALAKEWEIAHKLTAEATNNGKPNGAHQAHLSAQDHDERAMQKQWNNRELTQSMTILYFLIETTRLMSEEETEERNLGMDEDLEGFRDEIALLPCEGGLLGFLLKNISLVRWEEYLDLPMRHLLLLSWKATLLQFGNPETHLAKVKQFARLAAGLSPEVDKTQITASPLDYHMFRQDLIAKYPAYNPPKSLFPFEGPTFLPSLTEREREARPGGNTDVLLGGKGSVDNLTSILERGVHIATPVPSPPPSPVIAGAKGQKKHNYQTNQNFPFLYPPSDASDVDVNRRIAGQTWTQHPPDDGGGVPASIKEAGDLFSSRLRTTLAMHQLWQEREAYEKYRRGWDTSGASAADDRPRGGGDDRIPRWEEKRLDAVDAVYKAALPQLQSLVIVCFKQILQNISAPPPPPPPPPPVPQNTFENEDAGSNGGPKQVVVDPATGQVDFASSSSSIRTSWSIFGKSKPTPSSSASNASTGPSTSTSPLPPISESPSQPHHHTHPPPDPQKAHNDDLTSIRNREITSKAVTALLLVLLKWFRASHVLMFEYLTQLLLDSNYIPLVLKLLNGQDVVAALTARVERPEREYWFVCNLHSARPHPLGEGGVAERERETRESSPDDACPPPIRRTRPDAPAAAADAEPADSDTPAPITNYSWRNFFTSTNILRILQKVVKRKAHRNLALVQYKSSLILRKPLKAPQPQLRLYTLKVFKGQVPYCGRKWRQSNMRVITSIYLYCRPELRDDWLCGGDVDEEVEEALPMEQSLRALTAFWNARRCAREVGVTREGWEEGGDFFRREVERMRGFWEEEEAAAAAAGGAGEGEGWQGGQGGGGGGWS